MGTTLTGTTPQDTYDSLIKVTDNAPLTGSLKKLTDGLGNDSSLSLSTAAASFSGTLAVTGATTLTSSGISARLGNATGNSGANILIAGASTTKNWSLGVQQNVSGALEFTPTTTNGATTLGTTPAMVILDAGNVGIGTSSPANKLVVKAAGFGAVASFLDTADNGFVFKADAFNGFNAIDQSQQLIMNFGGAEKYRFNTDGTLQVGSGILFPATQVASANANALDDYEEGTWTMGVSFGGASVGVTYSSNTGTYTKIGRQVTVNGWIVMTSKGSSTGTAAITGLPFAIGSASSNYAPANFRLNSMTYTGMVQGYGGTGGTTIPLEDYPETGVAGDITDADFSNGTSIMLSFTYFV